MSAQALIVDDDVRIRSVLARLCSDLELQPTEVGDGQEAVDALRSGSYAVVLLDLAMPVMDGLGVLRWLRDNPPEVRPAVILVTAFADVEGKIMGTDLGALDFIEKPFRILDVKRRVRRAMNIVEMERRLSRAEDALDRLRKTDPVTGAEASGQLYEALEAEFLGARVGQRPLTCLVVSDENYHETLEEEGRSAGETRLQSLVDQMEQRLRGSDRIFRIDAAEFVLLLPSTPRDGARLVVDKIHEAAASTGVFDDASLVVAVASYPHPEITQAASLYRAANITLAKARSRQRHLAFFEGF